MDSTKRCIRCNEVKPLSGFGKDRRRKDGLHRWCWECVRENGRAQYRKQVARGATRPMLAEQVCGTCKELKPASDFYREVGRTGGLKRNCKACHSAALKRHQNYTRGPYRRLAYRNGTWTRREAQLIQLYGINLDDLEILEADQDRRCAICGEAKKLVVDHSHVSGEVRGLLCISCNAALGQLTDDSLERLERIRRYMIGGYAAIRP